MVLGFVWVVLLLLTIFFSAWGIVWVFDKQVDTQGTIEAIAEESILDLLTTSPNATPGPTAVADALSEAAIEEIPDVSSNTREDIVDSASQAALEATIAIRATAVAQLEPELANGANASAIIDSTLDGLTLQPGDLSEIREAAGTAIAANAPDLSEAQRTMLEDATVETLTDVIESGLDAADEAIKLSSPGENKLRGELEELTALLAGSRAGVPTAALASMIAGVGLVAFGELLRFISPKSSAKPTPKPTATDTPTPTDTPTAASAPATSDTPTAVSTPIPKPPDGDTGGDTSPKSSDQNDDNDGCTGT